MAMSGIDDVRRHVECAERYLFRVRGSGKSKLYWSKRCLKRLDDAGKALLLCELAGDSVLAREALEARIKSVAADCRSCLG